MDIRIEHTELSEKVYRLLLADLSLELRRSARPGRGERP